MKADKRGRVLMLWGVPRDLESEGIALPAGGPGLKTKPGVGKRKGVTSLPVLGWFWGAIAATPHLHVSASRRPFFSPSPHLPISPSSFLPVVFPCPALRPKGTRTLA